MSLTAFIVLCCRLHFSKHSNVIVLVVIHSFVSSQTYRLRGCDLGGEDFGDAEVSDLEHRSLLVHENVLGLQVTVQDLQRVYVLNGDQELGKKPQDMLGEGEGEGGGRE